MDLAAAALLIAAGFAGGVVTAIVGGATLITFPALLACGVPPLAANVANTVAFTPSNFAAAIADFGRMPPWDRHLWSIVAASLLGSIAGAILLLVTPEKAFTAVVPVLIGFSTILFVFADRIRRWTFAQGPRREEGRDPPLGLKAIAFGVMAVYAGYFGAGYSIMLLASLSVTFDRDLLTINLMKNFLSGLASGVAVMVFVVQGVVDWPPALAVMLGALFGGYLGGYLARYLPVGLMRGLVIGVGAIVTVWYAWRYW